MEKAIRLDKYLADMGKGTRTELKEMIRRGRIMVNGVIVKKPETKIKKGEDTICLDNAPVEYVERYRNRMGETEYHKTCEDHALPPDFEKMEYIEFLKERRLRMAQIVQKAYKKLCE